jgi:hypothetical protein
MTTNKMKTKQNTVICQKYWKMSILALSLVNLTGAPVLIAGSCRRERKCVARRTVRGATQGCL